jgi:protein SCO1/2
MIHQPLSGAGQRDQSPRGSAVPGLIGVIAPLLLAAWMLWSGGCVGGRRELPALGVVPEFTLTASSGQPFTQRDLAGRVWLADFIFTTCPSVCPLLSAQMAKAQAALERAGRLDVRLVSFSVDPVNDTPEVLRAYAQRFGADPTRWLFLTGERAALYALIQQGFHLAVAARSAQENTDGEGLITHSDRFILVDKDMQIRGYYRGSEADEMAKMLRDVVTLQPAR